MVNANIKGDEFVAGLAGGIYRSELTNCYSIGSVSGGGYVGGLVGASDMGMINTSYSSGNVYGKENIGGVGYGGLVGLSGSSSNIINSYSTADVTVFQENSFYTGGLVGEAGSGGAGQPNCIIINSCNWFIIYSFKCISS